MFLDVFGEFLDVFVEPLTGCRVLFFFSLQVLLVGLALGQLLDLPLRILSLLLFVFLLTDPFVWSRRWDFCEPIPNLIVADQ